MKGESERRVDGKLERDVRSDTISGYLDASQRFAFFPVMLPGCILGLLTFAGCDRSAKSNCVFELLSSITRFEFEVSRFYRLRKSRCRGLSDWCDLQSGL